MTEQIELCSICGKEESEKGKRVCHNCFTKISYVFRAYEELYAHLTRTKELTHVQKMLIHEDICCFGQEIIMEIKGIEESNKYPKVFRSE